ncbi:MAG TPA: hypothetical protein VHS79_07985, partial [Actinomycetes bacterium]|nr:hypothetical protein [Actinomycetes bacterium]
MTEQAVQVHGDRQLGPDPTGLGQPSAFQGPASQFGQGVGGALAAAAGVASVGRAGQRLQGGQQGLAGFGFQEAVDGHQLIQGWGEPHPSARTAASAGPIGAVGVGDQPQMIDDLAEPGWVQAAGGVDQDPVGVAG